MHRRIPLLASLGAAALLLASGAPAQGAAPPSLLSNENLYSVQSASDPSINSGDFKAVGACDRTNGGTITFTASGTAAGPYRGPFIASGYISFGPTNPNNNDAAVLDFSKTVDIQSDSGPVHIVETFGPLDPRVASGSEVIDCLQTQPADGSPSFTSSLVGSTYIATITTPGGVFTDNGVAELTSSQTPTFRQFNESFASNQTQTKLTNQAPSAAFSSSGTGFSVAFDGSASQDPDGSIVNYAYTYGDGTAGTGQTTNHTYAQAGTYTVTLTVTDNSGATGTVSHQVTVSLPATADQCKKGGWQNYGTIFKNQGDCVSFVATGGKNPPSGR